MGANMSAGDLAEFLKARLDEDEQWASDEKVPLSRLLADRMLREVEAKRAILDDWEDADWRRWDLPEGVSEGRDYDERKRDDAIAGVLDGIIATLAAVYSDHADYRRGDGPPPGLPVPGKRCER